MPLEFHDMRRGDAVPRYTFRAGTDERDAYLHATGESVDHWPEAMPPLALCALALGGLIDEVPLPDGAVHAGQELEFLRPVPLGAEVEANVTLVQRGDRRGTLVYVFDLDLRCAGEPVVHGRSTVIATAREQS